MKQVSKISGVFKNGAFLPHIARDGAPKKLTTPAPAYGLKRTTQGALHPFLHGQSVNDETLEKNWSGKQVPVHPGMGSKSPAHRGKDADGFAILEEAGHLGRPAKT